jgi:GAF domain-containing protein
MANTEPRTPPQKNGFFEKLVAAHPAIEDSKKQYEARLAAIMSLIAIIWLLIGLTSITAVRGFDPKFLRFVLPLMLVYFVAYAISRTPYYLQGVVLLVIAGTANTLLLLASGVENISATLFGAIPLMFVIGTTLFSMRGSIILVLANVIVFTLLPFFTPNITPRDILRDLLTLLFLGVALIITVSFRTHMEEKHREETSLANKKLKSLSDSLEKHIEELSTYTKRLEIQSSYLKGATEVSRAATTFTDAKKLSEQVVRLIHEHFDLYYVGLFILDKKEEYAVLRAGTGVAGEIMLANNHRLKVGEGMIGWAVQHGEPRIALDVGEDAVRFENPLLPETRSEGALPLRSRGRVLGALTIQSKEEAAFTPDIITVLQAMADQIAIAFDNAELLARSEAAFEAERRAYGELSLKSWQALIRRENIPVYTITADGELEAAPAETDPAEIKAIYEGKIIQDDGKTILLPIKSRGQILGGIRITKENTQEKWTKSQIQLAETLAEQLSVALESARLFEETQRKAQREAIISDISAKIGSSFRMDKIIQTTVKELGEALNETEVTFRLTNPQKHSA